MKRNADIGLFMEPSTLSQSKFFDYQKRYHSMISYAQNFEDVLLNRVFKGKQNGFYIDVGAAHPSILSVTKSFYDAGWSGINIDPIPEFYQLLQKERPRDINLNIALGATNDVHDFFEADFLEASSLDCDSAERANATISSSKGKEVKSYRVGVRTLADVCQQFCHSPIDFLKIDVEGFEREVLLGADFTKYQPLVIVVEATKPLLGLNPFTVLENLTTQKWEYILTDAGYSRVYFDGLNCFYLREKDKALHAAFSIPVNPYEFCIPEYELDEKYENIIETLPQLHRGHVEIGKMRAYTESLKAKSESVEARLHIESTDHVKTRDLLTAEKEAHSESQDLLAAEKEAHSESQDLLAAEKKAHTETLEFLAAEKKVHTETRDLLAIEKEAHAKTLKILEKERFNFNRQIHDLNTNEKNLISKLEELQQRMHIEAENHRGIAISMHAWDTTMRRSLRSRLFAPRYILPKIPETLSAHLNISEFKPLMKISVITPSFNSAQTIERAIQSVMKQDYHHWEHIIIDGGSTDDTIEILEKYKHLHWVSEPDRGQVHAMNKGFSMSTGDLIVYLNSDDYFNDGAFTSVVNAFSPEIMMVVGKVSVYDEATDSWWINDPRIDFKSILHHWEPDAFCVNPVGYFYRRHVQNKIRFREDNGGKMDLAFLLEAAFYFESQTIKIDQVMGCFMNTKDTRTVNEQSKAGYWRPENFTFIEPFLQKMPESFQVEYREKQKAGYTQRQEWINEKRDRYELQTVAQ